MIDKKKKGGLNKRYQSSYDSKESGAPKKAGVMNYKKCDSEISFFSPQEGKNRINIIPYTIKTKNHPLVKKGDFEVGDKDYVMDLFVHKFVGPTEANVICLKQTYGKPCPICEQAAALRKQGKEEEAGALKSSRRVFYNVEELRDPGKLKIFETSHYLFEKELIDEARDDDEGGFTDFADPDEGKEIKFRCSKVKKGNFEFNEFKSFSFEDRDEPLSDELLESAISFDEIMNVLSYEEAEKILFGQDDEEDSDEDEKPSKKSKKAEEDDDDEEDEEESPKKKPLKKPSKKSEDDEEDSDDDDEDEPAPKKKAVKKSDEDEEESVEEDDDDEEDERPKSKKACDKNCGECPFGHKFGKDVDEYDDCDDCDVWDKCINASK